MCGIAGFHIKSEKVKRSHDQVELFADLLLTGVEMRGKQATGMVAVSHDGKTVEIDKRPINASEFIEVRKRLPQGTMTFLGHTRYATQGSNENNANLHPVVYGTCFLTHNGGIFNDGSLFAEHGLSRHAEVDTEIIPALIDKYGWKDAAKALHEVRGPMAIAAIDPIKARGEVLLAKGESSPLYWYETPYLVVWASTQSAIRDAWKEVLGTPPHWRKLNELKAGDMLWLNREKVEAAKFVVADPPPIRSSARSSNLGKKEEGGGIGHLREIFAERRNNPGTKTASSSDRPAHSGGSTSGPRGVVLNRADAVEKLVEDGYGKAIVYKRLTDEERDELIEKIDGVISWQNCAGCRRMILLKHFERLPGEGNVCVDCTYVARHPAVGLYISPDIRAKLEAFCPAEAEAHRLALREVANQVDLDVDAVDYLVYRVSERYLNDHPVDADIAEKLDDLYQEAYSAAFDAVLDNCESDSCVADKGSEDEEDKPWRLNQTKVEGDCFYDPEQNTWVTTASCKGCAHCSPHPLTSKYLPGKCKTCKKFKKEGEPCKWCMAKAKALADGHKDDALQTEVTVHAQLHECWCGEFADVRIGRLVGLCNYHYTFCNEEVCAYGRSELHKPGAEGIRARANHLLTSGKRVCHKHSRSQKGSYSDKVLQRSGVIVQRIVPVQEVREPHGL